MTEDHLLYVILGGQCFLFAISFIDVYRERQILLYLEWVRNSLSSLLQVNYAMTTQFANLQQASDTLVATANRLATVSEGVLHVLTGVKELIDAAV